MHGSGTWRLPWPVRPAALAPRRGCPGRRSPRCQIWGPCPVTRTSKQPTPERQRRHHEKTNTNQPHQMQLLHHYYTNITWRGFAQTDCSLTISREPGPGWVVAWRSSAVSPSTARISCSCSAFKWRRSRSSASAAVRALYNNIDFLVT